MKGTFGSRSFLWGGSGTNPTSGRGGFTQGGGTGYGGGSGKGLTSGAKSRTSFKAPKTKMSSVIAKLGR